MGKKFDKPLEEVTEEEKRESLRYRIIDSANQANWLAEFGLK